MALFTFIMEYEGGTYASQVHAESVEEARFEWIKQLDVDEIEDLDELDKIYLIKNMINEYPTKVTTFENVWCLTLITEKDKVPIIDIVKTEKETDNEPLTINN